MADDSKWIIEFKEELNRELAVEAVDPEVQKQIHAAVHAAVISTLDAHQLLKPSQSRALTAEPANQQPIRRAGSGE